MVKWAFINRIGTAVPPHDIHAVYRDFMAGALEGRERVLFERMADRAAITHRYSVLPKDGMVEADEPREGFYRRGAYPGTAARMRAYASYAPGLALQAVEALDTSVRNVTHLIVASCTGFIAPGLDQILAQQLGLRPDLQRLSVGFMGCCAAVPALRLAQAIVLAEPAARVLVVNVELCTLHLQETRDLEIALSFLLFGDGAAAALVTSRAVLAARGNMSMFALADMLRSATPGQLGLAMAFGPGMVTETFRFAVS
jgi:predicted naringenin-chalcone synthase